MRPGPGGTRKTPRSTHATADWDSHRRDGARYWLLGCSTHSTSSEICLREYRCKTPPPPACTHTSARTRWRLASKADRGLRAFSAQAHGLARLWSSLVG